MHTLGGHQEHLVVSESGMCAAALKSRRTEAKRFRKWITREVLLSLRRTGKYQLHDIEPPPATALDCDPTRLTAGVTVVREARRLFGPVAARSLWQQAANAKNRRLALGRPGAMNDNTLAWNAGQAEHRAMLARLGLATLDELLTG